MAYISVDVDLDEFDDEDLISEIKRRGGWAITGTKQHDGLKNSQREIMDIIDNLRTFNCSEEIIRQIEDYFMLPLVSKEIRLILSGKSK